VIEQLELKLCEEGPQQCLGQRQSRKSSAHEIICHACKQQGHYLLTNVPLYLAFKKLLLKKYSDVHKRKDIVLYINSDSDISICLHTIAYKQFIQLLFSWIYVLPPGAVPRKVISLIGGEGNHIKPANPHIN